MQRVTSKNNPRLREAARLIASARDRRKAGCCVLEGEHLIGAYQDRYGAPQTVVVSDEAFARAATQNVALRHPERMLVVPAALFAELAALPAGVGMVAVVPTPQPVEGPGAEFCLLLDGVQDPGNVGSMLRSAAAAGVGDVLLSKHCAFAWSPKVLRAGQGAHFLLRIKENVDLASWAAAFRTCGSVLAAVAAGGTDLYAATLTGRIALAVGNEGAGLSPALAAQATQRVTIPMPGGTESINAAAAAAVCLFECVRQRRSGRQPAHADR
jgi:RNA methyltransferase, TrmH family